ncbi:MAG TPA: ROK family protein [Candidatus Limnocylindrales bacterium]|nr:ROK family protein [Candidatus Limnocylindrales bacterium]
MTYFIGIDLGGTKIAGAVYDTDSRQLLVRDTIPTQAHEGPDAVLARIAGHACTLAAAAGLEMAAVRGVGIGLPATFDWETGVIDLIPNLPGDWLNKPAGAILTQHLGVPAHLINDARAFTLAEATLGAGKGYPSVVGVTLGTGIGGGIVINGHLYRGLMGAAGEFGHHTIDMHGLPDGSGNPGGWESLGSGPAIAAMATKFVAQGATTRMGEMAGFDLNKITPELIMQAAEAGDAVAQDVLWRGGEYIGVGLSNILTILAPYCVVIGGGLSRLGRWITDPMIETIRERVRTIPLDKVAIVQAALGGDAGVYGAAIWAQQYAEGQTGIQ